MRIKKNKTKNKSWNFISLYLLYNLSVVHRTMWMLYSYRTYDYNCECGGSGIGSVLLQLELEQATQPRPTQRSPPPTTTTLAVPKPHDGKQQLWTHKFFFATFHVPQPFSCRAQHHPTRIIIMRRHGMRKKTKTTLSMMKKKTTNSILIDIGGDANEEQINTMTRRY
jgi:hypothetical protein